MDRDALPRLADRPDATGARVHRALDDLEAAQLLLPSLPPPSLPSGPAPASFHSSSRHFFQSQLNHHQNHQNQNHLNQNHLNLLNHSHDDRSPSYLPHPRPPGSTSDSQDTTSSAGTTASTDTDRLFTPPISEGDGGGSGSGGSGSVHSAANGGHGGHAAAAAPEPDFASHESHLLQLSELAAASERMAHVDAPDALEAAWSRKRTADGAVKHVRAASSASPVFVGGHARTTSAVSTAGRIGELSAELKAKLSYAMVKVNNGWQAHSIDQVESFTSQAASPASSTSTIHGRHGSSASPRLSGSLSGSLSGPSHKRQHSHAGTSAGTALGLGPAPRIPGPLDTSAWSAHQSGLAYTNPSPTLHSPLALSARTLAPPASIQPSQPGILGRRNSNPVYRPPNLSFSHHGSPLTSGYPSPVQRPSNADPILFSPHQNVREQDAIETLLFMSSPGNSANMKQFPSCASQPLPSGHQHQHQHQHQHLPSLSTSPQRHTLPSAPRKSLPTARPSHKHSHSQSSRRGRLSPSDVDADEPFGTPTSSFGGFVRGTPKRRDGSCASDAPTPRLKMPLSTPSGLGGIAKPRPILGEDDIEQMLDRAAAASADDSSDSDSEILIPVRRAGHVGV